MQKLQALLLPPGIGWGTRSQPGIEVEDMTSVHGYKETANLLQDVIGTNLTSQDLVHDDERSGQLQTLRTAAHPDVL